jgi:hypothetical protein
MFERRTVRAGLRVVALYALTLGSAAAQDSGDTGASDVSVETQGNTINVTGNFAPPTPSEPSVTDTPAYGYPAPGTDLESHLPSSSHARSDINQSDGFDLNQSGSSVSTVRGNADSPGIGLGKKPANVIPEMHLVRKGDTLWDLCAAYYNNPWMWPKVWSKNPQLQNPHWIYPGDQLRLREPGSAPASATFGQSLVLGTGAAIAARQPMVPRNTIFLRNLGYIDDPNDDIWGELVGAHEPQQLLADGNHVYMIMRPGVSLRIGQTLTVFRTVRKLRPVEGARMPPGELIAFKGAVKVTRWDPNKRMATAEVIEAIDIMERGAKIGQIGRRFDVVPPRPSAVDLQARILTSMYPHEIMGKDQVVFIDRGSNDGLVAGNRLFIVRRGDTWRQGLKNVGKMQTLSLRLQDPDNVPTEETPLGGDEEDFPVEVVGELQIVRAHKYSSLALVTKAEHEIEPGDQAVARRGK